MKADKNQALARRCIHGLTQYAAERRLGFEKHQTGNIGINPERREERSRTLIRRIAEYYGFGEEAQALVDKFDRRVGDARRCFGIEILVVAEQRETVQGLLAYAKTLAGDQIAEGSKDNREQLLAVSDHFEDMATCLSWDVSALGLYNARDWIDNALPRLTAWENILFTRLLIGGERRPNGSDFVSGKILEPAEVAATQLYGELSRQYPEISEWPAVCTVYWGGNGLRGTPRKATELDLGIMRRYGDSFVELDSIVVCYYPNQISVPRNLLREPCLAEQGEAPAAGHEQGDPSLDHQW